jgi:hypothetical protein
VDILLCACFKFWRRRTVLAATVGLQDCLFFLAVTIANEVTCFEFCNSNMHVVGAPFCQGATWKGTGNGQEVINN